MCSCGKSSLQNRYKSLFDVNIEVAALAQPGNMNQTLDCLFLVQLMKKSYQSNGIVSISNQEYLFHPEKCVAIGNWRLIRIIDQME